MRGKINQSAITNLPLNTILWDQGLPGFGVRRQRRQPVFILRKEGKQIVLGQWPVMTVEMARGAAIDVMRAPLGGPTGTSTLFKDVVDRYLAVGGWRQRSRVEIERHLLDDAQAFADRRLAEIDRAAVATLLNEVERRGPIARNRLRSTLSAMWNYAIKEGLCEVNPVEKTRRVAERPRDRTLTLEEIATLWRGLPSGRFGDIVRLLLLTGQRRQEIADLRKAEIILDAEPRIVLGAERTKSDRAHVVPLAPQAVAILARHVGDPIFDGFASFSESKAALDAKLGLAPWRLHDLRRSCASWIAELGFGTPWTVEAILNHRKPGIMAVYNKATHAKEMRSALTQWADHITAL
jgi:integrase